MSVSETRANLKTVLDQVATDKASISSEDRRGLDRVNALIQECLRDPFRGTGKPEPLSGNLSVWWSRRINREHRVVYRVSGKDEAQALEIAQCRYRYLSHLRPHPPSMS